MSTPSPSKLVRLRRLLIELDPLATLLANTDNPLPDDDDPREFTRWHDLHTAQFNMQIAITSLRKHLKKDGT